MKHDKSTMRYLMNDFVIQEHVCNLRCSYCLNFENENLKDGEPWKPSSRVTLVSGTEGRQRVKDVLDICRRQGDAPILRVAGGEVMALPGAADLIASVAPEYDRVQVLTNATFMARDIDALSHIPNLNLCCSLDGHTVELNMLRTQKEKLAKSIVQGVELAIERQIPVEIYTVLTSHNAGEMYEFAEWLLARKRRADVRFFPFPVRGVSAEGDMLPSEHNLGGLERIMEDWDKFSYILPPRAYFERLLQSIRGNIREHRCRIPLAILQSFDDGVLASCTNCWASPLGNALENEEEAFGQIGKANIHKLFTRTPPRVMFCNDCYTPFEMINIFLDGDCTLQEMAEIDLFSSAAVQSRLIELKAHWDDPTQVMPLCSVGLSREKVVMSR